MTRWPRKFRGLAGPASDTGEDGPEPESDAGLELISIPADSNVNITKSCFQLYLTFQSIRIPFMQCSNILPM